MTEHKNAEWYSACNGPSACVQISEYAGYVCVRDSKLGASSPVLSFTPEEWQAFADAVKRGEFDAYVHVRAHASQCA